jgi:hypothetical protein
MWVVATSNIFSKKSNCNNKKHIELFSLKANCIICISGLLSKNPAKWLVPSNASGLSYRPTKKNSKCKEMLDIICRKDVNREVRAFSPEGMKQDHANQ